MASTPDDPTKAQVWIKKGIDELDFEFYFPQGPKGDPGPFSTPTALGLTNHLDEYTTPGTYAQQSATVTDHILYGYPVALGGTLLVLQRSGTIVLSQTYEPFYHAGKIFYKRWRTDSGWQPWVAHGSQRVDQSAGRAIYQWDDLNEREQLIYGDTGYRDISASITDYASGEMLLRRIGSLCSVIFSGLEFTNVSATLVHSYDGLIPAGFQSARSIRLPLSPSPGQVTTYGSSGVFEILKGIEGPIYGEIMWTTFNSWPTTLPGTASGAIPNL